MYDYENDFCVQMENIKCGKMIFQRTCHNNLMGHVDSPSNYVDPTWEHNFCRFWITKKKYPSLQLGYADTGEM